MIYVKKVSILVGENIIPFNDNSLEKVIVKELNSEYLISLCETKRFSVIVGKLFYNIECNLNAK